MENANNNNAHGTSHHNSHGHHETKKKSKDLERRLSDMADKAQLPAPTLQPIFTVEQSRCPYVDDKIREKRSLGF